MSVLRSWRRPVKYDLHEDSQAFEYTDLMNVGYMCKSEAPSSHFTAVLHCLTGPVVKVSTSTVAYLGSISAFALRIFLGRVIPVTYKLLLQWLPCQAPDEIGSVLGLVGPVSVYCECVRQKV